MIAAPFQAQTIVSPIASKITWRIIRGVLRRGCGERIPRSGEKGKQVNCFTVFSDKEGAPHLLLLEVQGDEVKCLQWTGDRYSTNIAVPVASINTSQLSITHHYGLAEVSYTGVRNFILGRVTGWPYIKIHINWILSGLDQYRFNKKKLVTKRRVELLQFLVQQAFEGNNALDELEVMNGLYTMRWYLHPDSETQLRKVHKSLEWLVETEELRNIQGKFVLTGKALHAIEEYEEQERKHGESVRMQKILAGLTLVLAIAAIAQAYLLVK